MHEKMFANQQALSPENYEKWAKEIGLDLPKFKKALDEHRFKARIEEDQKLGMKVGANGTPTMYVNCRQVVGAQPFERFKTVVDEELKKADALVAKGVKLDGGFYDRICDDNVKAAPTQQAAAQVPAQPSGPVQVAIRPDDPVKGVAAAPVTVAIFSDFQCPFCSRVEPTLKQIEDSYKGQVKFVWKHQPLPFHPNAMPAAMAAEAAREQGKFWQMHDKLFENQQALSPENYDKWAKEIGLDVPKFKAAVASGKFKARIEEDMAQGQRIGANGTPTFFINGEKLVGAQPFENFKQVIDRKLQETRTAQR
jgi:protein-disulfide isomerase